MQTEFRLSSGPYAGFWLGGFFTKLRWTFRDLQQTSTHSLMCKHSLYFFERRQWYASSTHHSSCIRFWSDQHTFFLRIFLAVVGDCPNPQNPLRMELEFTLFCSIIMKPKKVVTCASLTFILCLYDRSRQWLVCLLATSPLLFLWYLRATNNQNPVDLQIL